MNAGVIAGQAEPGCHIGPKSAIWLGLILRLQGGKGDSGGEKESHGYNECVGYT